MECERNVVATARRATPHESENQQTLNEKLLWLDMQFGLPHRITANGHGRMCPGSPIPIFFMTCEPERITAAKRRAAIATALMLARVARPLDPTRCSDDLTGRLANPRHQVLSCCRRRDRGR